MFFIASKFKSVAIVKGEVEVKNGQFVKFAAVCLVLITMFQFVPVTAFAVGESETSQVSQEAVEEKEAEIIGEDPSKRDEYSKTYRREDGTFTQVQSMSPLHFKEDGQWKDIDNTLVSEKNKDGQKIWTNKSSGFKVELPKTLDKENEVKIQKDGHTLSFALVNDTVKKQARSTVKKNKENKKDSKAQRATKIEQKTQKVVYKNISANTDLEYVVFADGIKENFIVKEVPDEALQYSFAINSNGLDAVLQDDKSITFSSGEKAVFTIPTPVMYDQRYQFSPQIEVSLEKINNSNYLLCYRPSIEWLQEVERQYPVVIDPVIHMEPELVVGNHMEDTFIVSGEAAGTNYSKSALLSVMNSGSDKAHALFDFDFSMLNMEGEQPYLVTDASLKLYAAKLEDTNVALTAHRITSKWEYDYVTYNRKPTYDDRVIDFILPVGEESENFMRILDLTEVFNGWAQRKYPNYGIQLNASTSAALILSKESATNAPVLEITYRENRIGVNELDSYHSMEFEDVSSVYVNDSNQCYTLVHDDIGLEGNIMPVYIQHVYSPFHTAERNVYGKGWRINYAQTIEAQLINTNYKMLVYTDETGAKHYFEEVDKQEDGRTLWQEDTLGTTGQSNLELYMDANNTDYKKFDGLCITKADGTVLRFDSAGRLVKMIDNSQNQNCIQIRYADANSSKITEIQDGAGRKYVFHYTTATYQVDRLSKITCCTSDGQQISFQAEDGSTQLLQVEFDYTKLNNKNNELKKIYYPDGKKTEYSLSAEKVTLQGNNQEMLEITCSNHLVNKIEKKVYDPDTSAYLLKDSLEIACIDNRNEKHFKSINGETEIVQYNKNGQVLGRRSTNQSPVFSKYGADPVPAPPPPKPVDDNLIQNGDFTTFDEFGKFANWTRPTLFCTTFGDTKNYRSSPRSCSMGFMYENPFWIYQTVSIWADGEYTASVYFNGSISGAIELRATVDGETIESTSFSTEPVSTTNGEWIQKSCTFIVPKGAETITIGLGSDHNLRGEILIDDVELRCNEIVKPEPDPTPPQLPENEYNYIKNPDFTRKIEHWSSAYTSGGGFVGSSVINDPRDTNMDYNAYSITGIKHANNTLSQIVSLNAKKGDCFTISGWGCSSDATPVFPGEEQRFWGIKVEELKNGTYELLKEVPFGSIINGWQYRTGGFKLEHDVAEVRVSLCYNYEHGRAEFDGIQLSKAAPPSIDPSTGNRTCKCEECQTVNCQCTCTSNCACPQCKRRNYTVLNNNGQLVQAVRTDGNKNIVNKTSYTDNGNYIQQMDDSIDGLVNYTYDEDSALVLKKNERNYKYDPSRRVSSVNQTVNGLTNGSVVSNQYAYSNGQLATVTRNQYSYQLSYTPFGNIKEWKLGDLPLVTNIYTNDYRQLRTGIQYANGAKIVYRYDEQDRLTGISHDGGETYRYTIAYNSDDSYVVTDTTNGLNTTYLAEEAQGLTIANRKGQRQFKAVVGKQQVAYDFSGQNYLYQQKDSVSSQQLGTSTSSTDFKLPSGGMTLSQTSDFFDRKISKNISFTAAGNNPQFIRETSFTYKDRSANETSRQIDTYRDVFKKAGQTVAADYQYSYTFDSSGNILSVSQNGTTKTEYTYDSLGQLTSEKQNNYTAGYQYDIGGNLRTKTENGTVIQYEYNNVEWPDLLTGYNGSQIVYDANGNPLSYDGWTLEWAAGNQLKKMQKDGTTIQYQYDYTGQRVGKTVEKNNEVVSYDYYWHSGKLTGLTKTQNSQKDTMFFFYDQEGKIAGFILNGKDVYFYHLNYQGDVCAILDNTGKTVASYSYDAWGNPLQVTGELAELNPIRYRGYQYDSESGMYYLQSRYYSSQWGRFLNPDQLLSWNGSLLSTNLFLYCDNNPVNYQDQTGMFKKKYHSDVSELFAQMFFQYEYAGLIGEYCAKVDDTYSSLRIWDEYKQSFHFNIPSEQKDGKDSRQVRSDEKVEDAKKELAKARDSKDESQKKEHVKNAMKYFGEGLHPLQDMIAHSGKDGDIEQVLVLPNSSFALGEPILFVFHCHMDLDIDEPNTVYEPTNKPKGIEGMYVTYAYMLKVQGIINSYGLLSYVETTDNAQIIISAVFIALLALSYYQ